MTLLNHIGVFILLLLFWNIAAIATDKDVTIENSLIALKIAIVFDMLFEAFYWTLKIFF